MKEFYIAALTGRSGSGKSYASQYLAKRGIPTLDGDEVARQVVSKGSQCLKELVVAFGDEILLEDKTLNRRKLGDISFSDPDKKALLDSIIHPYIIEEMIQGFADFKTKGQRFCLVEAGAVVESGLYAICDKVIMITAKEDAQIKRIIERDGITEQQAHTRLVAQLTTDEVKNICDVVISNDGTLQEFENKLDILAKQLETWFVATQ